MSNYIEINKLAYDRSAAEFAEKIEARKMTSDVLVSRMCSAFEDRFNPARILELGPGSGYIAKLLTERGHEVIAIELSSKVAEVAQATAPKSRVVVDDFLMHDFKDKRFDIIVGVAFIHLFPEADAKKVVEKIWRTLVSQGLAIVATTLHDVAGEGYMPKTNFRDGPIRFRRQYTESTLLELLTSVPFKVIQSFTNDDGEMGTDKQWINVILEKQ